MNGEPIPYVVTTTQRSLLVTATSPERAVPKAMEFECCPIRSVPTLLPYVEATKPKKSNESKP